MSEILKPCPLCGATPEKFGAFDLGYKIICRHEAAGIPGEVSVSGNTEEDALAAWSRRASIQPTSGGEADV